MGDESKPKNKSKWPSLQQQRVKSTLVNRVEVIPGISDHDRVYVESSLRPSKNIDTTEVGPPLSQGWFWVVKGRAKTRQGRIHLYGAHFYHPRFVGQISLYCVWHHEKVYSI